MNELFEKLVREIANTGNIGERQARRIVYAYLDAGENAINEHANLFTKLAKTIKRCPSCRKLSEREGQCHICSDKTRNGELLMLVEHDNDIQVIEKSDYNGLYLVVGIISYSENNAENSPVVLHTKEFLKKHKISEIILAFSANPDGEHTAEILTKEISAEFPKIKISGFAKGLSTGLEIGYSDPDTIKEAFSGRKVLRDGN